MHKVSVSPSPLTLPRSCADEIKVGGTGKKPWLGIVGLTLTREIAHYYGFPVDRGVLVTRVAEGSPAKSAGLAEGDIILEISGAETRRIEDLVDEIHGKKAGDVARILAVRSGRQHYFELTLSEMP